MPLLQNENLIKQLRDKFPKLTHTSPAQLDKIEPNENVDGYGARLGQIVCATSNDSSRDFYALRTRGMINHAYGEDPSIFIFERINKDEPYFEHTVPSENFIPIVCSADGKGFYGEWVSSKPVVPMKCRQGIKGNVLKQTNALVFTIAEGKRGEYLERRIKGNPYVALKELLQKGILISENPDKLVQIGNELIHQDNLATKDVQEIKEILKLVGTMKIFSKVVKKTIMQGKE